MSDNNSREKILKVDNLKQHFITGSGKYKIYNKAVDGVSFDIYRGEVFSLVGESGCGKTTTGRTIIRLYKPTDGEVFLHGKRIVAGYASIIEENKKLRKELKNKKKDFQNNLITIEEYNSFKNETLLKIKSNKQEIAQRKKDQINRYLPLKEEIEKDKEVALKNIEELKIKLNDLEESRIKFKNEIFKQYDELPSETSNETKEKIHAESLKKYREQRKKINLEKEQIKEEIIKYHMSYKEAGRSLMKKIQMIFQDPIDSLNPRMTVKEIIAEGLYINGIKNKQIVNEKVYEALKLVGLMPEHASHYPHEFSGGQRQRVGIARAIVCDPDIIVADEPISALDVSIQAQVINLLNDLKEQLGLTILFIAHDLSVVKYFSDRVAVMYFGHIVEIGDKTKIFDNPLHPYTKSLISSIPQPNPEYEKYRSEILKYNPAIHNYTKDDVVELREIEPNHMVRCSEKEFKEYQKIINENKK